MSMFSITSCSVDAAAAGGGLERVQVHAHEVDELDLVLGRGGHVLLVVAQREQAGVELRVQRLDAPAHDLREAREVLDRADLEPGLAQRAARCRPWRRARRRAPRARGRTRRRRSCPRPRAAHAAREPHPAAPSPPSSRGRYLEQPFRGSSTKTRRGGRGQSGRRPRAISATAVVSRSCSTGAARRGPSAASVTSGSSSARCRMTGPESTPSSTKWTVTPNTLTPYASACSTARDARKRGQQRGMHVDHPLREARRGTRR